MTARPEVTGKKTGRRLLTYHDLRERGIPWTRLHVGRLEAAGKFPLHIDVGDNSIAWFEDEIDDFFDAKAAERDAKATERAAKANSAITDSDCGHLSGGAQGHSAGRQAPPPRAKRRAAAEV
jgi:prophage regulatory protein